MRFCEGKYYVHERFMDVMIYVLNVSYSGDNYTKLKISWWNTNRVGEPFQIDCGPSTIKIKDASKWREYK